VLNCFAGKISAARGPKPCSIIRKLHFWAYARVSFRSLGKVSSEIAVLSWKQFYSQRTTTLLNNQENAPLRNLQTELSLTWQDWC
jgi:hypothetical protein